MEIAGRNLLLRLSRIGFNVILLNNRHDIILQSAAKQMNNVICLFISKTGETHALTLICYTYNPKSIYLAGAISTSKDKYQNLVNHYLKKC